MIKLTSMALLKGRQLPTQHEITKAHTDRQDVGIYDISSQTHIAYEAICSIENEATVRELLNERLRFSAQRWERHFNEISEALIKR